MSEETAEAELPTGWTEVQLSEVLALLETGSRPRGGVRGIAQGIPSIGGEHLDSDGGFFLENVKYVPVSFFENMRRGLLQRDDILVVKDGATTGKVSLVRESFPFPSAVVNEHVFICRFSREVLPHFVFWFLWSQEGQKRILENFQGSAQGGINQGFAPGTVIPIAPYEEQTRIVAKVETLLARVNAVRQRLAKVPALLKRFRQSVLAAACSGKLTEDWREDNFDVESGSQLLQRIGIIRYEKSPKEKAARRFSNEMPHDVDASIDPELPESWAWCRVEHVAKVCLGGTPSRKEAKYWDGEVPWVSSGEVDNCRIRATKEQLTEEGLSNSSAKIYPPGTVLIAMIGEGKTRGQSAILDIAACTNQNVAGLVFDTPCIVPEYPWLWALSLYEAHRSGGRGGNYPALNGNIVRQFRFPLAPVAEQHEIVRRVDALLARVDRIEKWVATATQRVETLTQAILAQAFRGELVPTEAELARQEGRDYEPAAVLLERIRTENALNSHSEFSSPKRRGKATK